MSKNDTVFSAEKICWREFQERGRGHIGEFEEHVTISAPAEKVWDALADF